MTLARDWAIGRGNTWRWRTGIAGVCAALFGAALMTSLTGKETTTPGIVAQVVGAPLLIAMGAGLVVAAALRHRRPA